MWGNMYQCNDDGCCLGSLRNFDHHVSSFPVSFAEETNRNRLDRIQNADGKRHRRVIGTCGRRVTERSAQESGEIGLRINEKSPPGI